MRKPCVPNNVPTDLPPDQKRFSDFAETLHIDSTPKVNFLIFGVKRENFLMGLKIDFRGWKFGIFGLFFVMADQFSKEFNVKKWILDFAETCNTLSLDENKIEKKKLSKKTFLWV